MTDRSGERILVAQLPKMTAKDKEEFEHSVPIFGQQRAIRRKQLSIALLSASSFTLFSVAFLTRQTWMVRGICAPLNAIFGGVVGDFAGRAIYPSVADNKETRMVKNLWWANRCSSGWSYDTSKFNEEWRRAHPHIDPSVFGAR
eukprot:TRINITY_DN21907_c0_g1_i1.p1 TRINITY_DN21907_c0_g1~~TRINITY_DN21907_c0_g1_i1.p1  ORF type:complete len:144 (-),score=16.38 TRINITY_DN21907_c0_g1_i1:81-512(-)